MKLWLDALHVLVYWCMGYDKGAKQFIESMEINDR